MAGTLPVARKKPAEVSTASASGSTVPLSRISRMSGLAEPQNLSATLDVSKIQSALRSAERGDTWMFFTICRDITAGHSHLQAEWSKRKMVIVGQPQAILPYDASNEDDVVAAEVIEDMIEHCRNWQDGLQHFLDGTLYPMSVGQKVFQPVSMSEQSNFKHPLRYTLKEIAPIPHIQLCFKIPYMSNAEFDPDQWESSLRIYETLPSGAMDWMPSNAYPVDPTAHVVHRGNLLSPSVPANFGGHIRAVLFWCLFSTQDRDWWALMMQKYGMPLIIGKADAQQKDTISSLRASFALATQIGGLVVDKSAEVQLEQMSSTDGSNAHKIFSDFANCEISKLVVGQVLSSTPKNTGLGSGMADQAEGVRDDMRTWDTLKLQDTLRKQLFTQFLRINGYSGRAPRIFWGGYRPSDANTLSKTLQQLSQGGYRLTDDGIKSASQRFGLQIERAPKPIAAKPNANPNANA